MNNREKGNLGEEMAEKFLTSQNCKIIARNFRKRTGEIDLIAEDRNMNQLVFVEVKLRKSFKFGLPEESITYQKKQKIINTALHFLAENNLKNLSSWRIDLIAVKLKESGELKEIKQIKNIIYG
jgi:putative endonuclease